jgi:chemotaxis protein MotB
MARKKKHPEHVNHERWLISYADFITLLFAFFVVMFAVSQVDSKMVGRFTQSFNEALEWQVIQQPGSSSPGGEGVIPELSGKTKQTPKTADYPAEKDAIRKGLAQRMGKVPVLAGLHVLEVRGELVLRLPEKLMFDPGEAALSQDGKAALGAIAEELLTRPVRVRVEGHTDTTPIHNARFPSNWELSMGRAMAVVAFLLENSKIAPGRLGAAGYGQHHPIASNDTLEGRAQNRRVDIIVVADFESTEAAHPHAVTPASASASASASAEPRAATSAEKHESAPDHVEKSGEHKPAEAEPAGSHETHEGRETKP